MSEVVRLVEIRSTALDVAEVVEAVADRSAGGVDLFIGRVRDHDAPAAGGEDRTVTGLDYTAHPTALARLRDVAERVAAAHDIRALAAVHRTGALAIGDIAVIVATASGHRAEAFAATRDLIDTLKSEVPIWKHQLFADGGDEWVGTP